MADQISTTVWIRSEDVDHPKLERLRRAATVAVGKENDVDAPLGGLGTRAISGMVIRQTRGGA